MREVRRAGKHSQRAKSRKHELFALGRTIGELRLNFKTSQRTGGSSQGAQKRGRRQGKSWLERCKVGKTQWEKTKSLPTGARGGMF